MVLNKKTYDALPYAYMGLAVLSLLFLDSRIKYVPATVLLCAGLLILAWRNSERRRLERSRLYRRSQVKTKLQHSYFYGDNSTH